MSHTDIGTLYCYWSVCLLSHPLVFWHYTSCLVWLTGNWDYFSVFLTDFDRFSDARKCHVSLYTAMHSWSEDGNEAAWWWCFSWEEEQADGQMCGEHLCLSWSQTLWHAGRNPCSFWRDFQTFCLCNKLLYWAQKVNCTMSLVYLMCIGPYIIVITEE